jgi:hypothetical protein
MNKEKTFIIIVVIAVAALAIFKIGSAPQNALPAKSANDPNVSNIPTPGNASGLDYLTYNTPWYFSPPVANVMPWITKGNANENAADTVVQNASYYDGSCGCGRG